MCSSWQRVRGLVIDRRAAAAAHGILAVMLRHIRRPDRDVVADADRLIPVRTLSISWT